MVNVFAGSFIMFPRNKRVESIAYFERLFRGNVRKENTRIVDDQ